jgi:hypothetical protein
MKPDLMIVAGGPAGGPASTSSSEQAVPVGALAMPDDQQQMTDPEPGDVVTYEVTGKVARVEGGTAYVRPEKINGQDVAKPAEPAASEPGLENDEAGEANRFGSLKDEAEMMGPMP